MQYILKPISCQVEKYPFSTVTTSIIILKIFARNSILTTYFSPKSTSLLDLYLR